MKIPEHGILPGALWWGMTRQGFSGRSHVRINHEQAGDFPSTKAGVLLPMSRVAFADFEAHKQYVMHRRDNLAKAAFRSMDFDTTNGCWQTGVEDGEAGYSHTDFLWMLAERDMGGTILYDKSTKERQHVCDTAKCLNPRHYDLIAATSAEKSRRSLGLPDYRLFQTLPDGTINIAWLTDHQTGELATIPSVEDSARKLMEFQQMCPPYVGTKDAALNAHHASKLTLDPVTGCWLVKTYYEKYQVRVMGGEYRLAQTDGYGRLKAGPALIKKGASSRNNEMAHRVTPYAFGSTVPMHLDEFGYVNTEMDHKCGVRRCCNPDHLQAVSKQENNERSRRMQVYKKEISQPALF